MNDSAGGQTRGAESSSYLMSPLQAASVVSGYIPCDQLAEQEEAQVDSCHTHPAWGCGRFPISQLWMVHHGPFCMERVLT